MTAAAYSFANDPRYTQRTVEWGNWGITFMEPQPDRSKNYGVIAGRIDFAVGPRGPIDAGAVRQTYRDMCTAWVERGAIPAGFIAHVNA